MELRGTDVLVTGASSGIGRAIALRLASEGASVVAHGRDRARTASVAQLVGGRAVVADLATAEGVAALAAEAGAVEVVVASAGFGWSGPFAEMPGETLEEMVAVDLSAPMLLTHALLPAMLGRRRGRIVLVGSVAGRTGVAGEAVYAACKAALDGFAESLRLELATTGVGVTVVVPGAVRTAFFARRGRAYDRRFPRPVSAEQVAEATTAAILADRDEAWVPQWLRVAPAVRAVTPGLYRRLAARFGERL